MYAKIMRFIYKIEHNYIFASIRKGFILLIPFLLIGSFALLLKNFPVAVFQEFIKNWAGGLLLTILNFVFDSTVGFMSAYLVMSISYYYSSNMKEKSHFIQVMAMVVSMVCFVACFGAASGSMELVDLGPVGVFTAMFCAIAATKLFYYFYRLISKEYRFHSPGSGMDYRNSLSAIYPVLFTILIFVGMNLLIQAACHVDNLNDLITNAIVGLFHDLNDGLGVGVLYLFVLNFLWMFGIHGGNAMEQVAQTYLVPNDVSANVAISKSFLDNFALIGGCGTAICLLLAILLFARSRDSRQLARSAGPAVLFNINELLVSGLPIVLNPIMMIPFILTPICSLLIAYGATAVGFLPVAQQAVTWTTPVFFSGYLASGSYRGVLVQVVVVAVGTAIYAPFVCLSERFRKSQAEMLLHELTEYFKSRQAEEKTVLLLDRHDSLGTLARNITAQLRVDVEEGRLLLGYQPQIHADQGIVGAEALLRWKYMGEMVYPPLLVALAQEDGFFDQLTECVVQQAMSVCGEILREGREFNVSVNITAEQMNNPKFVEKVIRYAKNDQVEGHFGLEITEESSVDKMKNIPAHISRLKSLGIRALVDDFSMGSTSLKYLQHNSFYAVKLDGSLVKGVVDNPRNQEIIASIVKLGKSLDFVVIAEYVETEEIRDTLRSLGCFLYQGYLYSPAVPYEKLTELLGLSTSLTE